MTHHAGAPAPVDSRRARNLGALLALGALALGGSMALTHHAERAADGYDPTSLRATAERFVSSVNAGDWLAVSLAVAPVCRQEAYERAMGNLAVLEGARAKVLEVDERAGTTTISATYPATGQVDAVAVTRWFRLDGRWTSPLDGCDPGVRGA